MAQGKLVEFVKDSYPHCLGDVVRLTDGELDKHPNSTYQSYKAADNAQEAEIVPGEVKSFPENEPSVEIAGSAQAKDAAEKGKK